MFGSKKSVSMQPFHNKKRTNSLIPKIAASNLLSRDTKVNNANLPHVAEMLESSSNSENTSSEQESDNSARRDFVAD